MVWTFLVTFKAGVLFTNVTPDPIVMLPDPELVVNSPTFKIPFAIIYPYSIILYPPKLVPFNALPISIPYEPAWSIAAYNST